MDLLLILDHIRRKLLDRSFPHCWVYAESWCEFLWMKELFSRFSLLHLLNLRPLGFQSQKYWELISAVQVVSFGVPDTGHKPQLPGRSSTFVRSLVPPGCWARGEILSEAAPLTLLPILVVSFNPLLRNLSSFPGLFQRKSIHCIVVDFVCLWEEVESASSQVSILIQPPSHSYFYHRSIM